MKPKRVYNELCWFGACVLAMASFLLATAWFDARTSYVRYPAGDSLLIIAAVALIVMVALVALGSRLDRDTYPDNRE
jgi:hypothetical protein